MNWTLIDRYANLFFDNHGIGWFIATLIITAVVRGMYKECNWPVITKSVDVRKTTVHVLCQDFRTLDIEFVGSASSWYTQKEEDINITPATERALRFINSKEPIHVDNKAFYLPRTRVNGYVMETDEPHFIDVKCKQKDYR